MAGGASTPELAAAVGEAGGLGFLAAGYKTPEAVREEIAAIRSLTARPFGVNVFAPPGDSDPGEVERYAARLRGGGLADRDHAGPRRSTTTTPGRRSSSSSSASGCPVVSFAFGCPPREVLAELRDAGAETWVTVTTPAEARTAARAGADALVVQGVEAGAHRGSFDDAAPGDIGLLALLQLVRAQVDLPMVAAGRHRDRRRRGRGARGRCVAPPRWGRRSCARARPGRRRCTARRWAPTSRPR